MKLPKEFAGVDEVFAYDKKSRHKGFLGIFKFAFEFPYKNRIDCSFVVHTHERSLLLSRVIGSGMVISAPIKFKLLNLLISHQYKYTDEHIHNTYKAEFNANYLKFLTGKPPQSKMRFDFPEESKNEILAIINNLNCANYELIGLSPCSKDSRKNWSIEDAAEFIKLVNSTGRKVVVTGTKDSAEFVEKLKSYTQEDFIDLTSKTSVFQLAALISICKAFVSVDTGSMHISYSIDTPTVCLFFSSQMTIEWGPQDTKNNLVICNPYQITGRECFEGVNKLIDVLIGK